MWGMANRWRWLGGGDVTCHFSYTRKGLLKYVTT